MKRGEFWWADLGNGEGSEQEGRRPVMIIQNDVGNEFSPTVIVAATTDTRKRFLPTHIRVEKDCGLPKDSVVMLEQIRTISKTRLSGLIAAAPENVMAQVDRALGISIGLIPAKAPKRA